MFIKSSVLSGIDTAVKLICGFIVVKYVAMHFGTEFYAKFSQFQTVINTTMIFMVNGISLGVIKYISELHDNKQEVKAYIQAGSFLCLFFGGLLALCFTLLGKDISVYFLGDKQYSVYLYLFSVAITFFAYNQLFISILNGLFEINRLITVRIISSISTVVLTIALIKLLGFHGALISLVTVQALILPVSLFLLFRTKKVNWKDILPVYRRTRVFNLKKYLSVSIVNSLGIPITYMFIRKHLAYVSGWNDVGLWDGAFRLSNAYFLVISTAISIYFYPKISSCFEKKLIVKETHKIIIFSLLFSVPAGMSILFFQGFIIRFIFSDAFMKMDNYLYLQMIASLLNIIGVIFANVLLAKTMLKKFYFSELVLILFMFVSSYFMINWYGIYGLLISLLFSYVLYTGLVAFFVYTSTGYDFQKTT